MILIALAVTVVGCGASSPAPPGGEPDPEPPALRLRHQIMVRYGGQVQVFEGYMILKGESFLVKAFAGPGIDLFTVRRDRAKHAEEAHVAGLAERLDLEAVGADIARAYLAGCEPRAAGERVECSFYGEPLSEEYDDRGRTRSRTFPGAHGIGLTVTYEDYAVRAGRPLAEKIKLAWGSSGNEMVIRLLEAQEITDLDERLLAIP
jgi:hypothetical protein